MITEILYDPRVAFLLMVGIAVFLLAQSTVVPAFSPDRKLRKRLRKRIHTVMDEMDRPAGPSLLRERYLRSLSPLERALERLPGMEALNRLVEQAGYVMPGYRIVLVCLALGATGGILGWMLSRAPLVGGAGLLLGAYLPILVLRHKQRKRQEKFEEQLPDALETMVRALRAGHPFNEALHLVSEEMSDPVAREFGLTFADINYGSDVKGAFLNLLERVPNMSLMTLVTAVLVQRETGGNLAEILEKISKVIRGRFRFQRKVKTLSAEGRMSAWVLVMVPFVLVAMLSLISPDYLPVLVEDPTGRKIIGGAFVVMVLGIFWIRRIIRIEV